MLESTQSSITMMRSLRHADHSTTVGHSTSVDHSTTMDHFPIASPFAFALLFLKVLAIWSKAFVSGSGFFLFSGGGRHFKITSPPAFIFCMLTMHGSETENVLVKGASTATAEANGLKEHAITWVTSCSIRCAFASVSFFSVRLMNQ